MTGVGAVLEATRAAIGQHREREAGLAQSGDRTMRITLVTTMAPVMEDEAGLMITIEDISARRVLVVDVEIKCSMETIEAPHIPRHDIVVAPAGPGARV